MPFWLHQTLTFFNIFPFLFAIRYYTKVDNIHLPFLLLVFCGAVSEWVAFYIISVLRTTNAVQAGIYVLLELWLVLWLFYRWRPELKKLLIAFLCIGTAVWIIDNLIIHTLQGFNPLFRIVYSFMLVYLSIDQMNEIIFNESAPLQRNGKFIICLSFLLYYTYKAIFETFFFIPVTFSNQFYRNLFSILTVVNALSNIIFVYAIICLAKKRKYI